MEKNLQRVHKISNRKRWWNFIQRCFGMRRQQGKLKEVVAMMKQNTIFVLLVDDAHGFGTLGKTGAGAGEEQGSSG
jgi:glycine C-acetyltransferase